ncbi:MAG: hypothetical protein QXI32_03760 [Candidatus Bathyarchaeia archaeon]
MSVTSEEEIWKQVWRRYNQNPLGMRMYAGVSPHGHPELLIVGPQESWIIKRDSPYSGRPGIGGVLQETVKPKVEVEQAGLRPIPRYALKKMMAMAEAGVDIVEVAKIIGSILAQDPVSFEELERIRPPSVMQGPIVHSPAPIQSIIGGQVELDMKLEAELQKLRRGYTYIR